ncbi:hypothetical protein [Pseudobacteriovorax antillogorgiicola]|uniref:Outer membrane protein beta-barrel domain-containing protein n=1 Tax=Pseudobacteriovorax antillogorgiicola TaxID=1513793 RepID=A0A1Y6BF64_9BACT|nr:hypothetical protein [Pseudobacteriovorax antillogorgiicola]TCS56248.1 hypothetical protein EDD56_10470 [Pseudobacteriovorax antillogorgiicola]SMF08034.1 hypothetical protein SAMN06296036_104263 [Pseudobacteriovorax antillogorgiicola]
MIRMVRGMCLVASFLMASPAFGFLGVVWEYISQYQIGIDYSASTDVIVMSYEMDRSGGIPSSCVESIKSDLRQICTHDIVGGQSSGFGLFLQQAFRRQGDYHVDFDLSLGVRYLTGQIPEDELLAIEAQGLPLTEASFTLGVAIAKPYIELGYTPLMGFPDILLRFGPVIQAGAGAVSINEESKDVAVAVSSGVTGYVELEIVFLRFGDGAFSIYSSKDGAGRDGTPLYPDSVAGMDDFEGEFKRSVGGAALGYGMKLVLNWP